MKDHLRESIQRTLTFTKQSLERKENNGTRKKKVPEECEKKKHGPSLNFYLMCVYA
jgi:hypothetical protein